MAILPDSLSINSPSFPVGLSQLPSEDLAFRTHGQAVQKVDAFRLNIICETLFTKVDEFLFRRLLSLFEGHGRLGRLSPVLIRHTEDGNFEKSTVLVVHLLHLIGVNIKIPADFINSSV
jgi:hypothetical protein